nr:MAG TPA_asm: hypothetical protein [Caudoviricetes sp.]
MPPTKVHRKLLKNQSSPNGRYLWPGDSNTQK